MLAFCGLWYLVMVKNLEANPNIFLCLLVIAFFISFNPKDSLLYLHSSYCIMIHLCGDNFFLVIAVSFKNEISSLSLQECFFL